MEIFNEGERTAYYAERAREILSDGGRLLSYAKRVVVARNPNLWRRLRERCIREDLSAVEALLEAVNLTDDYLEYKLYAERNGRSYTLAEHIERCIEEWLYHRKLREEFPSRDPERQVLLFHVNGAIRAILAKGVRPKCPNCGGELVEEYDGSFVCVRCGYDP